MMKRWAIAILLTILGGGVSACADGASWKEEVVLHDGSKIHVERNLIRKGRHEPFQRPSIGEQRLSFILPATKRPVVWKDEFSEDLGSANFLPMMLEIDKDMAYLVVSPMGCLSYNKWGRPNPPYVVFKYQGKTWNRIALEELPVRFKTPNLIISAPDDAVKQVGGNLVSAETVKELNNRRVAAGTEQPHLKQILREPVASSQLCPPQLKGFKAPDLIPPKDGGEGGK
ncbi:MAG: hypothetical protein B7X94_02920 [Hydrogenophilales bacterium 17-62-8]|nr:MAG: hypothetical protein B7X94_02920 [Hydrogenophilales bacterium 17-62-8]